MPLNQRPLYLPHSLRIIQVEENTIPTRNYPKIQGVTLDRIFKTSAQATANCHKMKSRNKVLKGLAGRRAD